MITIKLHIQTTEENKERILKYQKQYSNLLHVYYNRYKEGLSQTQCKHLELNNIELLDSWFKQSCIFEAMSLVKKHKDKKLWLHSGDLGYMDSDGFVYFKSRLKRMIVSSGYNIYPGQIEEIISSHPYVKTCEVVGVPHPYKKEVIKAYIVLKDNIELTSEVKRSIKSYCEKNIASYSLPYAYGYRKELPKTLVGKVAYRKLLNDEEE